MKAVDALGELRKLVSPYGVVTRVESTPQYCGDHIVHNSISGLGSGQAGVGRPSSTHDLCKGTTFRSAEDAELVAIAEGAERYAGKAPLTERAVWASAAELAGECLEPHRYPRCSAREYAQEKCPLVPFDTTADIRWVSGTELVTGRPTWVPAVMASYAVTPAVPAECVFFQISTGHAVHFDPVEAVVRAICEVAERDSVAVLWWQQLPLRRIAEESLTERTRALLSWQSGRFVRPLLLDATSDLGVPTAYCLTMADHDVRANRFVSAGTGRSLAEAAEKALLEGINYGALIREDSPPPKRQENLGHHIGDTSTFMAAKERADAFDFLVEAGERDVSRSDPRLPDSPEEAYHLLVDRMAEAGMRAVVVDLTTEELAEIGLSAVSVVIPDLQPMSVHPWAQYKGHSRLYTAPERMGYRVLPEEELNPWPQPFA